ncbi:MAG: helix-turn-helix transcriptional regulator [Clostridia bacterium]|nr:helix-turn-helix transcriptional regulator [Clostridia bacterium]
MFSKNLRNIRLQQGLSQKQVADFLIVSPQSVSKWEKGEALPSIDFLPKLAECLKCDINVFFKPIQKKELDLGLLGRLFEISYDYIYNQKEIDEEFNAFFIENTSAIELLMDFETELKQQQIIKNKTVQGMFDCSESQAAVLMDYFVNLEFVEKFDNEDSYFVLRDNIGGLKLVLKTMLEVCSLKFKEQN